MIKIIYLMIVITFFMASFSSIWAFKSASFIQTLDMEAIQFKSVNWIRIALVNFFVLALIGVALRYKINFPLPLIDQKYLLQGHSHFAFVGWISLALMTLMINYLVRAGLATNYNKYHWLLLSNTFVAYGMLITFTLQGYAILSITFSTLSIFVSYLFIYYYWKDLRSIKNAQHIGIWFKSALVLLGISSLGPFTLAYLMVAHIHVQNLYFSAIYFFLHFQYNGWFIFACLGLLISTIEKKNDLRLLKLNKPLFFILASTVVPTYLLSLLGLKVPLHLHWIAGISAGVQLGALYYSYKFLQLVCKNAVRPTTMTGILWCLAYFSFSLKVLLQGLSALPYFTDLAFTLRPIIIAYLHLCFLGVISFFILGHCVEVMAKAGIRLSRSGLFIFIGGVLLQEGILMAQGMEAIVFQATSHTGIILFLSAIVMAAGLLKICIGKGHVNKKPLQDDYSGSYE